MGNKFPLLLGSALSLIVFHGFSPAAQGSTPAVEAARSESGTDHEKGSEEAEHLYNKANKLREDGKINDAIHYCDMAIKLAPQGDWGKRAATLKLVALPDHSIKEHVLDLLKDGTKCAEKREFDQAGKLFRECLSEDPDFIQASGSLAYVLINQQKYDEAIKLLSITIEKYPSYARGYFRLAQAYEGAGKVDEAKVALEKAKGLAPDDLVIQVYNLSDAPR